MQYVLNIKSSTTILNAPLSLYVTLIKFPLSDFKLSFLCKLKNMKLQQFYERPTFENKVTHELTWCVCYTQLYCHSSSSVLTLQAESSQGVCFLELWYIFWQHAIVDIHIKAKIMWRNKLDCILICCTSAMVYVKLEWNKVCKLCDCLQ